MSRPTQTLQKALRCHISPDSKLLIAVSGGLDSACLLHGCVCMVDELRLILEVAHVDHGLRRKSHEDAEFVEDLAEHYGLPFHLKKLSDLPSGENDEDWGRRERYSFFGQVMDSRRLSAILTAHTASDVAETLLMRLVANKEPRSILRHDVQRRCLRPLWDIPRVQLEEYALENDLKHVEDESNLDENYLRNRVRARLIPFLAEHFDSRIEEVLSSRAVSIAEDLSLLDELAGQALEGVGEYPWGEKAWLRALRARLDSFPDGLAWRAVELLMKAELGFNIGRSKSMELLKLIQGEVIGVQLPSGWTVRRRDGGIVLERTDKG